MTEENQESGGAPLHEAQTSELPPQIAESEGAMAHEAHGYSVRTAEEDKLTGGEGGGQIRGQERWDARKAETIGAAVQENLYSPNFLSKEGIRGHPAESDFREKRETSFEQLYNIDPEKFGQMPTHEFMTAATEYARIVERIQEAHNDLVKSEREKSDFLAQYGIHPEEDASPRD